MLQINRIKAIVRTELADYGFDYALKPGLNFITSSDNTLGKSSVLLSIYYCLGLEEIIGGKGHKVLTSVYKSNIDDGEKSYDVLESEAYLEIYNGCDTITIYRSAIMENRSDQLITVYFSSLDNIADADVEDMYVHSQNSATNRKGFHTFLERFIGFDLPKVPANDDKDRKLYMQLIFSCIFIEQKRGWADIFSGMPILGIKESKKRVLEYILALDTLKNERIKNDLIIKETYIKNEWQKTVEEILSALSKEGCQIVGLIRQPRVLDKTVISHVQIRMRGNESKTIDDEIKELEENHNKLRTVIPKIVENFDGLQAELEETEKTIQSYEGELYEIRKMLIHEDASLRALSESLDIVNLDIRNNKDAAKLKKLGSEMNYSTQKDTCPLCNQQIQDSLLLMQNFTKIMSIEENIKHLDSQKKMIEFAISGHKANKEQLNGSANEISAKVFTLRRLAQSLRSDLYSVNEDLSEAIIYKRISIENNISNLREMKQYIDKQLEKLEGLSSEWRDLLKEKSQLPKEKFTQSDLAKINFIQQQFKGNLQLYNYKSVINFEDIKISTDTYLPAIQGFDMKFDSSASDNIRAIWAFTIALMQTSIEKGGNHPDILIFDEPAQHSIVTADLFQFFKTIMSFGDKGQVIIGITVKDIETKAAMEKLDPNKYHSIDVGIKALQRISTLDEALLDDLMEYKTQQQEYLNNRIFNETGVQILSSEGILNLFGDMVIELHDKLNNSEYSGFSVEISKLHKITYASMKQNIMSVLSNVRDEFSFDIFVKVNITEGHGEESHMTISAENANGIIYEADVTYQNGEVHEDISEGVFVADKDSKIDQTAFCDFVDKICDYIDKDMNTVKKKIDHLKYMAIKDGGEVPVADFPCYNCNQEYVSLDDDIYPRGFCINCGEQNEIHECQKCGTLYSDDGDEYLCGNCKDEIERE